MIQNTNEWKKLIKHVWYKCKCKFDSKKCNSNQIWNNDKCWCECKNPRENVCKKGYTWDPATCSSENGRNARSIVDYSVITCDEIIEKSRRILIKTVPVKGIPTSFDEKKMICKMKNFCILLAFLLNTMKLLIAVSICFLIKYRAKQTHLLPFHDNSKTIGIKICYKNRK